MYIFKEAFKANWFSIVMALLALVGSAVLESGPAIALAATLIMSEFRNGIQVCLLKQYRGNA